MLNNIKALLEKLTTQEKSGVIMGALYALRTHGFVRCESEIESMLNADSVLDSPSLMDNIHIIVETGTNVVLTEHQIETDTELDVKVSILEGLIRLQDWDDPQTIVSMCDGSDDAHQTFCDLLEMVTEKTWSDYASAITKVSPSIIERLSAMYTPKLSVDEETSLVPIEELRMAAIKKFIEKYPASIAKGAIYEEQYKLGTSFDIVIQNYHDNVAILEPGAPLQAALELVGIGLISDIPFNDFVKQIKDKIDNVYSDINFITDVDVAMDGVVKEVLSG